jgi:dolichyl-phosphate-mannose-protein mannosyltransferase
VLTPPSHRNWNAHEHTEALTRKKGVIAALEALRHPKSSSSANSENGPQTREVAPDCAAPGLPRAAVVLVLLLTLLLFGLIRYRQRTTPLERDEGEYAYSGQLMLQGIPPYKLVCNMKLPGIYTAYAMILEVFGETPAGIRTGLIVVNSVTVLLLYFLAAALFGRLAGVVTACSWALLSASSGVMGFEAHATNFVAAPAIFGILLLVYALRLDRPGLFFLSGMLSGIAVLMKQHGAFFVLFCLLYLWWSARRLQDALPVLLRRAALYAAGVALPYAITCALLYKAGVFRQFWFWTVSYAGEYSKMGLRRAIHYFLENSARVTAPAALIWVLAAVGLSAIWWGQSALRHAGFLVLLLICSFLSLCPGAYFHPHYWILFLPIVAILAGVGVSAATERLSERYSSPIALAAPAIVFLLCFGTGIFHQRQAYFSADPLATFETTYPGGPYVQAVQIADYVERHTAPTDRIAVIGSEPEIYFYTHRPSATVYIYTYSLIVWHKLTTRMREEFMSDLETNQPEYLVYVDVWDSWGEREGVAQAAPFLARLQKYMNDGYEKEGVADIGGSTQYVWGEDARAYVPRSSSAIWVLRRRPQAKAQ